MLSLNGPDHEADRLERVETSAVFGPEDSVLEFAAVNSPAVPHTVQVGLAAGVVPPAALVEVGTVTWRKARRRSTVKLLRMIPHFAKKDKDKQRNIFFQKEIFIKFFNYNLSPNFVNKVQIL